VYRIVQEALTNVIRQAKATRCTVSVDAGKEAVTVQVIDGTAAVAATGGTGYGLRGMRERVAAMAAAWMPGRLRPAARVPYHQSSQDGRP
jgi:signal transduction histidine kinase